MKSSDVIAVLEKLKAEEEEKEKIKANKKKSAKKKAIKKKKPKKKREKIVYEYALYKKGEIVLIGSMKEIAEHENITVETARYYSTPIYKNKIRKYKGKAKYVERYFRKEEEKKAEIIEKAKKVVDLYNIGFRVKEVLKII